MEKNEHPTRGKSKIGNLSPKRLKCWMDTFKQNKFNVLFGGGKKIHFSWGFTHFVKNKFIETYIDDQKISG